MQYKLGQDYLLKQMISGVLILISFLWTHNIDNNHQCCQQNEWPIDCFEEMCSPKPLDLLQKLIAMVSPGNAEETETVQQIENVTGSNLLSLLYVVSTHICLIPGSVVLRRGPHALVPRAGTDSALSEDVCRSPFYS